MITLRIEPRTLEALRRIANATFPGQTAPSAQMVDLKRAIIEADALPRRRRFDRPRSPPPTLGPRSIERSTAAPRWRCVTSPPAQLDSLGVAAGGYDRDLRIVLAIYPRAAEEVGTTIGRVIRSAPGGSRLGCGLTSALAWAAAAKFCEGEP